MSSPTDIGLVGMTDLEITRLCAEAMGFEIVAPPEPDEYVSAETLAQMVWVKHRLGLLVYSPLHDDAQAMALVKKLDIDCESDSGIWTCYDGIKHSATNPDLNRAICECVAKMRAATHD